MTVWPLTIRGPLVCIYHVWADGRWRQPLAGFVHALRSSGYPGPVKFSIVGEDTNRQHVIDCLPSGCDWVIHEPGNEAPTINLVREHARAHDGAVLYAHTKGAACATEFRDRWRQSMTLRVILKWRENLQLLDSVDAVGCHWLTRDQWPGLVEQHGFFGGNFWMARCDYLRTLPECAGVDRMDAERWVGLNDPRVVDLLPGWPGDERWPELCSSG